MKERKRERKSEKERAIETKERERPLCILAQIPYILKHSLSKEGWKNRKIDVLKFTYNLNPLAANPVYVSDFNS